jgi:hypothetical protein
MMMMMLASGAVCAIRTHHGECGRKARVAVWWHQRSVLGDCHGNLRVPNCPRCTGSQFYDGVYELDLESWHWRLLGTERALTRTDIDAACKGGL